MRTTPGVALWGWKPRRKYFSLPHVTRWTDHLEPKTYFILALYKERSRRQQCYSSRSVYEGFLEGFLPLLPPVWTVKPPKQYSTSPHIQDTSSLASFQDLWVCLRSHYWMLPANYTIGHCLDPKDRAGKWGKINSAQYHRMLTGGPASEYLYWIPCIGRTAWGSWTYCKCGGW